MLPQILSQFDPPTLAIIENHLERRDFWTPAVRRSGLEHVANVVAIGLDITPIWALCIIISADAWYNYSILILIISLFQLKPMAKNYTTQCCLIGDGEAKLKPQIQ